MHRIFERNIADLKKEICKRHCFEIRKKKTENTVMEN